MPNADIKLKSPILLTLNEQRKLVDLLFDCHTTSRKETRDVVVQELPNAVRGSMERDYQNDKLDIRQIVVSCRIYSGGLEALIDIVKYYEGDSIPFQVLNSFVQELFARDAKNKKEEQLEKLKSIVLEIGLTASDLKKLYRASAPEDPLSNGNWQYPKDLDWDNAISKILTQLADALVPASGIPPILMFAEQLAKHTNDPYSGKLRKWVDDALPTWDANIQSIDKLRKELAQAKKLEKAVVHSSKEVDPPSLLIMLELVDKSNQNEFTVKAWLLYGREGTNSQKEAEYLHVSNKSYTSDTILKLINELLTKVAFNIEADALEQLRIEFFLPRELFYLELDSWKIDGVRLGIKFPVIIRSSERIKDPMSMRRCEAKWKKVSDPLHVANVRSVYWADLSQQYDGEKVFAYLRDENVICLGLTTPPITNSSDMKELFSIMFQAGTPIALWPKRILDDPKKVQKFKRILKLLLLEYKFSKLPESVMNQRLKVTRAGNQLDLVDFPTLLVDDPTRLPPEFE